MATWPSYDAGTARLTIEPHFGTTFQEIDRAVRTHDAPPVLVPLALENLTDFRAAVESGVRSVTTPAIQVSLELANTDNLRTEVQNAVRAINAPAIPVDLVLGNLADFRAEVESRVLSISAPPITTNLRLGNLADFTTEVQNAVRAIDVPAIPVDLALGNLDAFRAEVQGRVRAITAPDITVDLRLGGDTAQMQAQIAALSRQVTLDVNLDLVNAYTQMAAFRAIAGRRLDIEVHIDTSGAMGHLGVLLLMMNSLDSLIRSMPPLPPGPTPGPAQAATAAMKGFGLATTVAKVGLVALAGVSLIPLIGQLVKAAGVVSLLPGMAAAAAASFGAVKLGLSGVGDALTAGGEAADAFGEESKAAAKAATQANEQLEDAQKNVARTAEQGARQIKSAEKGVAAAQRDSLRAQEDLNRAREDAVERIEDLNLALLGSALDEESAMLAVDEAYERMLETMFDPDASINDQRRADIDYRESIQRLAEVRERNADLKKETEAATKSGVEGSNEVVAAKERIAETDETLIEAEESLALAQRDAAEANAEAIAAVADAQEALNEAVETAGSKTDEYADALAKLSPNARDFVETVQSMRDEWDLMQLSVQDSLFDGLGPELRELGEVYMPILTGGFTGLADVLNTKLRAAMDWLQEGDTADGFKTILDNTTAALGPLLDGMGNLGRALYDLAVVGSDFLPGISQGFDDATGNWADSIREMRESGELHEFMQEALDTFSQLGRIVMNIGSIGKSMFSGSDEVGETWLDNIETATAKWAETLGSPDGQKDLKEFFADVKDTVDSIVNGLAKMGELMLWIDGLRGGRRDSPVLDPETGDPVLDEQGNPVTEDTRSWWRKGWDGFTGGVSSGPLGYLFGSRSLDEHYEENPVSLLPGLPPIIGGKDGETSGGSVDDDIDAELRERLQNGDTEGSSMFGDPAAWGESFAGMGTSLRETWDQDVFPVLDGAWSKAGEVGGAFLSGIGETATDAWNGLTDKVSTGWNDHIMPAWNDLREKGLGGLADDFVSKITDGAVTSWEDLPGAIKDGVADMVDEYFPGLGEGIGKVETFFGDLRTNVVNIWNGLLSDLATGVNHLIDLINWGVGGLWSKVDGFLLGKLPDWTDIQHVSWGGGVSASSIPGMETGGLVPLEPGTTWGKDGVLRVLAPGEFVLSEPAVRAAGVDNLAAFNNAARGGRPAGPEGMFALEAGGRVTRDDPAWEMIKRGHDFAKAQDGKPYQWGGPTFEGDSFDCTGLVLSIAAEILGHNPWQRYGYTGSFTPTSGPLGFESGLGAGFSIGVNHDPGGPGGGHAAGTFSNVEGLPDINVESGGWPSMVKYGTNNAAGASHSQFPWKFHLPIVDGAFVDPGPGGGLIGGPTPEEQGSLVGKFIDKLVGPLRAEIVDLAGAPPPQWREVPPAVFDGLIEPVKAFAEEKASSLEVVAQGVRDLKDALLSPVENAWDFVFNRDTGGNLPPGLNLVLNKTGEDEYILNPDGFEVLRGLIDVARTALPAVAAATGQPGVMPAGTALLDGTGVVLDHAQDEWSIQADGTLTKDDMVKNTSPEAQKTFEEYGTDAMAATTPQQRMEHWSKTYSQKWANYGRETAAEIIDDVMSPLGMGVSIGTMVTQDVPEAVTRLTRLANMQALGYMRTMGR